MAKFHPTKLRPSQTTSELFHGPLDLFGGETADRAIDETEARPVALLIEVAKVFGVRGVAEVSGA